jgi:hypothetical protein
MTESGPKPEQAPRPIQELLASREEHEQALDGIIEKLKDIGYTREGESVETIYPSEDNHALWKKRIDKYRPKGAGRGVAEIISHSLSNPPSDPERSARLGKDDHLAKLLEEQGYIVKADIDFESMMNDVYETTHVVYEKG